LLDLFGGNGDALEYDVGARRQLAQLSSIFSPALKPEGS